MAGHDDQRKGDGQQADAATEHRASHGQKKERKQRPGEAERPEDLQRHRRGEGEDRRGDQRRHLGPPQLAREEKRAERGDEKGDRRGIGEAHRGRQEQRDPGEGAVDRRLHRRGQRLAAQFETIQQRPLAVLHRPPHRLPPRNHDEGDVGEHRILHRRHAQLLPVVGQRRHFIGELDRRVDAAVEERAAREQQRQEQEREGHAARDRRDEAIDKEEECERGGEVKQCDHARR